MRRPPLALTAVLAAAVLGAAGAPAPAAARDRVVTLKGFDAPGPARDDKIRVLVPGRRSARQ
jgi:hypothetical protein